ncbi:hypothetical protein N7517_001775 [Penicillium concentricum]|uniref:Uncharacterized protein n=1 Tax=Penicillium concentricum TaxID=293559 RepID=A0A9W9SU54_9EURO|nr:uncharacterized protein N7517_001775 [Penicillium concentricum]KAJ5383864.1 hypothetical protein N7517_001775 [Penicillium concentricum]
MEGERPPLRPGEIGPNNARDRALKKKRLKLATQGARGGTRGNGLRGSRGGGRGAFHEDPTNPLHHEPPVRGDEAPR